MKIIVLYFLNHQYRPDFRIDKILSITNITELQYQRSVIYSTVNFIRVILSNYYS